MRITWSIAPRGRDLSRRVGRHLLPHVLKRQPGDADDMRRLGILLRRQPFLDEVEPIDDEIDFCQVHSTLSPNGFLPRNGISAWERRSCHISGLAEQMARAR